MACGSHLSYKISGLKLLVQGRFDFGKMPVKTDPVILVAYDDILSKDRILSLSHHCSASYREYFSAFRGSKVKAPVCSGPSCYRVYAGTIETGHLKTLKRKMKTAVKKENPFCGRKIVSGNKAETLIFMQKMRWSA